ncbi:MAG: hypothetical protein QOD98_2387 [Nocardioidaceae bacterium]|jgi:hypothetical protein|nr:hypothetical protein [Nocardioidaceae bacterium]
MTESKYETAFRLLYLLAGEGVEPGNQSATTGWAMATVKFEDDEEVIVGTDDLNMLHEELLGADPTGLEGSDFLN